MTYEQEKAPPLFIIADGRLGVNDGDEQAQGLPVRAWLDVCHSDRRHSLFIDYDSTRSTSRWTSQTRKRPFVVRQLHDHRIVGASKTLAGAIAIGKRLAGELT